MTHPTEEEMVDRYYSCAQANFEEHLASCRECRAVYRAICETLELVAENPLPARGPDYGSQVWARLSAQLPARAGKKWLLVPALAAGLGMMFAAGMWTEHLRQSIHPVQVTFVHAPANFRATPPPLTHAEQDKKQPAVIHGKTSDQSDSPAAPKQTFQTKAVSMMRLLATVPARPQVFALKATPTDEKKQIQNSVSLAGNSPVLLDILKKQPDPAVRAATIRSLAVRGERSNVLTNVYKTDTHEDVRKAVLDVLVVQQNSDALSELARDEPDAQRKKDILSRVSAISYRKIQRPPP